MKLFFTAILVAFTLFAGAQQKKITPLDEVEAGAVLKPDETIAYGSFLRKPGIWHAGPQSVIIRNLETGNLFFVKISTHDRSSKECIFCFYIKPGKYAIVGYRYETAKWYGDLIKTTPVFKGIDYNINIKAKVDSGLIKKQDLSYDTFKIEKPGLYYAGKWHFETGTIFFTDEKAALDKKLPTDFYFLKFNEATTLIPD